MAYTAPTANTVARGFTEQWLSLYDAELEPQVWPELYQKYGKGFGIFDWLTVAGQTFNVKSDDITAFEEGALVRPVRLNSSGITAMTSAGDDISFILHANEYDANGHTYLRAGDTIVVPSKFMSGQDTPAEFLVTSVGASGAACAASPLDTNAQITSTVTGNSYLMVGATRYARGTAQPTARSRGLYSRTFETGISKETMHLEGGQVMQATYRAKMKNGGEGLLNRYQAETEFMLNNQLNLALLLSDDNDNSVYQTSHASVATQTVQSTVGLWNWLDSLGQKLNYAVKISLPDLYTAKELLRSQGVVETEVLFGMGDKLSRGVETLGLDYIKEYSGGSNLMDGMGSIGIRPNRITIGNVTFVLKELAGFTNPATFGTDSDYWGNAGFIIPMSNVTVKASDIAIEGVEGGKIVIPNVALGYVNNAGENRTRIIQDVAGVNGVGLKATHAYDDFHFYMLTEYMLVAMQVNQMVRILKEGTY